jgi:hypothetical protein
MKTSRITFSASLLILGVLGATCAGAAESAKSDASCHEETRRIAVWQQGGNPKFNQSPRFENRAVTVCDGKVVSQSSQRKTSNQGGG